MPEPHVNTFYRIWFTWVDPIVLLATVFACISTPQDAVEMLIPASVSPYDPNLAVFVHQAAALYAFMGIMFAVLLRASPDPKVWRIVQGATLFVDLSLIVMTLACLKQQGRSNLEDWRGIDFFNLLFTIWVAVIRVGFLACIGETHVRKAKRNV
jgi:disulfide bond formation protein DsbB